MAHAQSDEMIGAKLIARKLVLIVVSYHFDCWTALKGTRSFSKFYHKLLPNNEAYTQVIFFLKEEYLWQILPSLWLNFEKKN